MRVSNDGKNPCAMKRHDDGDVASRIAVRYAKHAPRSELAPPFSKICCLAAGVLIRRVRNGGGANGYATFDIKGMPSYSKHHLKSTQMSLERALQSRTPDLWSHYSSKWSTSSAVMTWRRWGSARRRCLLNIYHWTDMFDMTKLNTP